MKRKHCYSLLLLVFLTCILASCSTISFTNHYGQKADQQKVFAIKDVHVITMNAGSEVLQDATVVIKDKKIVSLNGPIPADAEIIDGKGKWLIPGLIDMHVHVPVDGHFNANYPTHTAVVFTSTQDVMTPFVANGVTTIFELSAKAGHFGQRNEIARGDVIGPRMALAALIEGGDGPGRIANTPPDGRQAVRMAKAEGYEFIKVYSKLNVATFKAVVDEAGKQGMRVVGHIPNSFEGRVEDALVPHFDMVAHAEEYAKQSKDLSDQDAQRFARLAKENGTWLTPTLTIMVWAASQARSLDELRALRSLEYVHPLIQSKWLTANNANKGTGPDRVARLEKIIDFNNRLVKAFREAGVPIVAGTDAGCSGVVWGFSLHDELELLVDAGLSPGEALASATRLPAGWLGIDSLVGTVEAGKFADLILLDANPLKEIRNTRKISGVFVNGRWLDKAEINAMLSDLAGRNTAARNKYHWSKRGEY